MKRFEFIKNAKKPLNIIKRGHKSKRTRNTRKSKIDKIKDLSRAQKMAALPNVVPT